MNIYKPRLTSPNVSDKNWIGTNYGGYNIGIVRNTKNGDVLPNCTSYCYGRWQEILNTKKTKLCHHQAELWYTNKDPYKRGQVPKLGAIICFQKGSTSSTSDGCGHVAVVEEINDDGSIIISESGWNSKKRFWTQKLKAPNYNYGKGYKLQGFIYLPKDYAEGKHYEGVLPKIPKNGSLHYGCTGLQVRRLQEFLNWANGCNLELDSSFGLKTKKQVIAFQKKCKITPDGYFGPESLKFAKNFVK